jgi:hypothetical protein
MKTGLIIQGPLFSPGYGPYEFQSDGRFEKAWIEFDCKENVLLTIMEANRFFDYIVLVTWKNKEYSQFIKSLENYSRVTVIELEENDILSNFNLNGVHKYHQVETLKAGAGKLEELGCEFVGKIRTDHSLNIKLLAAQVKMHQHRNRDSLGVPNINLFELDRLTDFYFVGRSSVIREMCEFYMNRSENCKDTHRDYFLSFLLYLSKNQKMVSKIRDSESKFIRDFYSIVAWTSYFYPLSASFFKNFTWRGRLVNHRLNGWIRWFYSFHESRNALHILKLVLNLILLLSIRWIKRPTIKFSSALLFRFYRWRASRLEISTDSPR